MKILAASLLDSVEQFLHAGYISSQPTSSWPVTELEVLTTDSYPAKQLPQLSLDVAESLRLQGEQLAAAAMETGLAGASGAQWSVAALGVVGIALYHVLGRDSAKVGRAKRSALAAGAMSALVLALACNDDAGPSQPQTPAAPTTSTTSPGTEPTSTTPTTTDTTTTGTAEPTGTASTIRTGTSPTSEPTTTPVSPVSTAPVQAPTPRSPWEGVTLRKYANPEQATRVILHGLIGNALIFSGSAVESLASLRNYVELPTQNPTEGEAYALTTYGLDGWGKEFRLRSGTDDNEVTSAGADGLFATTDDLTLKVPFADATLPDRDDREMPVRSAWYVSSAEQSPYVLFQHVAETGRICGSDPPCYTYIVPNASVANSITGGKQFGAFSMAELPAPANTEVAARYRNVADKTAYTPLILEVFGT